MVKFSSRPALLVLSLLMAGSSWAGSIAPQQAAMADARSRRESVRGISPARSLPTPSAIKVAQGRPWPATDVWLTVILGGGLIALQLRRTQRSVRMCRLAV
jgi:hypothetical protein